MLLYFMKEVPASKRLGTYVVYICKLTCLHNYQNIDKTATMLIFRSRLIVTVTTGLHW